MAMHPRSGLMETPPTCTLVRPQASCSHGVLLAHGTHLPKCMLDQVSLLTWHAACSRHHTHVRSATSIPAHMECWLLTVPSTNVAMQGKAKGGQCCEEASTARTNTGMINDGIGDILSDCTTLTATYTVSCPIETPTPSMSTY